ncbi:hypothetical protein [Almyronema epifaneia]|uniref:Uncharacterized protein n=1 Tax=Almyronema epifaneia S1 TaxID=2991925 RepID=A0ABW6IJI4_9CYAN
MTPILPQLYLLVPWDLPSQMRLSAAHQVRLSKALCCLLRSLEESPADAIATLEQALATLNSYPVKPAEIVTTQTPLKSWEVADFDQYFNVTHVQAQEPSTCLVASVLLTCRTFFLLLQQDYDFDPTQIERQKRGFVSQAHLLARVFNLDLENA